MKPADFRIHFQRNRCNIQYYFQISESYSHFRAIDVNTKNQELIIPVRKDHSIAYHNSSGFRSWMWCPHIQNEAIFSHSVRSSHPLRTRDGRIAWLLQKTYIKIKTLS